MDKFTNMDIIHLTFKVNLIRLNKEQKWISNILIPCGKVSSNVLVKSISDIVLVSSGSRKEETPEGSDDPITKDLNS